MKQILPDSQHETIRGAFIVDEAALVRLDALIRGFLGSDFNVEYQLGQKDNSRITSESRSDLNDFPLHHVSDRKFFEILYSSPAASFSRTNIDIKYNFDAPSCRIYISNHPKAIEIQKAITSYVIGTRAWYSPIYTFPMYWLLIPTWAASIILTYSKLGIVAENIGIALFLVWIMLTIMSWVSRRWLFDSATVLFGAEVNRQSRRASARKTIAIALFTGVVVTAAGGYFQNFFAKPNTPPDTGSKTGSQ